MIISELFNQLPHGTPFARREVRGISRDSRQLSGGEAFFVIEGDKFDIFKALEDISRKVSLLVVEEKHKGKIPSSIKDVPLVYVDDVKKEFNRAVDIFYPVDLSRFGFIGVTGTNGKTTTAHIMYQLIRHFDLPASLLGTVHYCIEDECIDAPYTTPDYFLLRKLLSTIKEDDIRYVVMEVSSHGLVQERIWGIPFRRCIFTNLSHDHLDYHGTMEEYFQAKTSFFSMNPQSLAVLNVDDPYGQRLRERIPHKKITYATSGDADFLAKNIKPYPGGTDFTLRFNQEEFPVRTGLIGIHNVSNILAALATLYSYGFDMKKCIRYVKCLKAPCGRMEEVIENVYVDYAHTPDALEKALVTLKQSGYKEVICVFGCGGDRDKSKRPVMGQIATQYADETIITSDNPRSEDPLAICREIEKGCSPGRYSVIADRRQAITQALMSRDRRPHSAVLIAGKGHEAYQIVGARRFPFKDQDVISEVYCKEK
ncbi:MAG: UDP-N-acetylmuramoyl-L-alanyl-D-glutamate--2,6-diaminopimelate ligase [Candidatus Omnitrophica bacterium]|nr:UDP-N-acetylmuramoyl-L-alanyl-D-glutamate--2,6-diaminopimelate ligase [Candidatus Omnitrophota bacterium]